MTTADAYTLDLALADAREHLARARERLEAAQKVEQSAMRGCGDDVALTRHRLSALAIGHLWAETGAIMERLP